MSVKLSSGWRSFPRALKRGAARMSNTRALHGKIAIYLVESTRERFTTGKDPTGKKWKQSTRVKIAGGQVLVDKARLRDSMAHKATQRTAQAGTNVIYGRIHQKGGEIKAKKAKYLKFMIGGKWVQVKKVTMPKRSFLGINDEDTDEISRIIVNHIAGAFS